MKTFSCIFVHFNQVCKILCLSCKSNVYLNILGGIRVDVAHLASSEIHHIVSTILNTFDPIKNVKWYLLISGFDSFFKFDNQWPLIDTNHVSIQKLHEQSTWSSTKIECSTTNFCSICDSIIKTK